MSKEKHAKLVGSGIMFMWCCSMLYWISNHGELIGIIGTAITSASGLAVFIYINSIENRLREIQQKNEFNIAQSLHWQDQSQMLISKLEMEKHHE